MPSIVDNRLNGDQTVLIFDEFYSTELKVNPSEFDIINSYFIGACESKRVADNFTVLFFRIAQEAVIDPMVLFENLKGNANTKIKLNEVMTFYFNSFKSKTSLYGIGVLPKPNQSVARNIVL